MKLNLGSLTLDLAQQRLLGPSGEIRLRPKSFEVLRYLAERAGNTVTKDELMAAVWPGVTVTEESLTRCVSDIRQALGERGQMIKTLPKRGYLLEAPATGEIATPAVAGYDLPSIAVLAFANLSRDPDQDYFCDGITEDIITELARFSELVVIARNSSFQYKGRNVDVRQIGRELGVRYVLEGSIQRNNQALRVVAQLVDATSGAHLWADRFDRAVGDTFAIQDEIANTISALLPLHINNAEARRTLIKPTASWEAYDYFLRGNAMLQRLLTGVPVEELYKARELLRRSIELDPTFPRPYASLGTSYSVAWINPIDGDYQSKDALQQAFDHARKAVELGPNVPQAHDVLANVALFRRDHATCIAAWDRVFELNPNYCNWRHGHCLVLLGRPVEGLAAIRRHMRLDPFYPPHALMTEGLAYFVQRKYEQALPPFREMVNRASTFRNGLLQLAATYGHLGREREAREQIAAILQIEPDCSLKKLARNRYFQNAEDGANMMEGLRKAGIPEG
jgi:adenylate cyclase